MNQIEEVKTQQCELTKSWPTKAGVIAPIISIRNKENPYNITYKHGKKAGKIKKFKLVKDKDLNNAQTEVSNG